MPLKDYRIIVIDDHFLLRQMVGTILKDQGVLSIDSANDGVAGIAKINEAVRAGKPYHIILLDWSMAGLSGYDVLKIFRADKHLDSTAIVMLTAESEDVNIVKTLEAGATAYITKPFTPEGLIKKLEDISGWLAAKAGA